MSNYNKTCVQCGVHFVATNGHKKTCSQECEHERRVANLNRRWAGKACKNICKICGRKFLRAGNAVTCGRATCKKVAKSNASRIGEAFLAGQAEMRKKKATQEYPACREWSLRSPDGEIYSFRNMSYFVVEYAHLFDEYELERIREYPRAYYMLSRLSPSRKYKAKSWHGWTWGE